MEPEETLEICLGTGTRCEGEFRPEWRTEAVVGLANGILEDEAFNRLPILADALEESGCTLDEMLRHCRDVVGHSSRCWVLDWIVEEPVALAELVPTPDVEDDAERVSRQQRVAARLRARRRKRFLQSSVSTPGWFTLD